MELIFNHKTRTIEVNGIALVFDDRDFRRIETGFKSNDELVRQLAVDIMTPRYQAAIVALHTQKAGQA